MLDVYRGTRIILHCSHTSLSVASSCPTSAFAVFCNLLSNDVYTCICVSCAPSDITVAEGLTVHNYGQRVGCIPGVVNNFLVVLTETRVGSSSCCQTDGRTYLETLDPSYFERAVIVKAKRDLPLQRAKSWNQGLRRICGATYVGAISGESLVGHAGREAAKTVTIRLDKESTDHRTSRARTVCRGGGGGGKSPGSVEGSAAAEMVRYPRTS